MSAPPVRYSRLQVALHWATLLLLLVSFFSADWMKPAWRAVSQGREFVPTLPVMAHVWVGVTVLVLTLIRIIVRLRHGAPAEMPNTPPVQAMIAKVTHYGLYALLIAVPASGALAWFGGVKDASEIHEVLFNGAMLIVGLHVVGALYHQFYLKDGILSRMRGR